MNRLVMKKQPTTKITGVRAHWMFGAGCSMLDVFRHRRHFVVLALLGGCLWGEAQTRQSSAPAATDYAAFSRFVTERNIFDPNRQPHFTSSPTTRTRTTRTRSTSAPSFSLVGTMAYAKGYFAFFNGNSDELKRTMSAPGRIAGYTVTEIAPGRATLESADQREKIQLKVGDVMRQESGKWELAGQGEVPAGRAAASSDNSSAPSENSGGSGGKSDSTPPSAIESNDILKKLMQKREQENQ
jgi:hypothetical protein